MYENPSVLKEINEENLPERFRFMQKFRKFQSKSGMEIKNKNKMNKSQSSLQIESENRT